MKINKILIPDNISKTMLQFEMIPISFYLYENHQSQSSFITSIYTYRLAIVTNGKYAVETKGFQFTIEKGDILLVPPFNAYNIKCISKTATCFILNFNIKFHNKENKLNLVEEKNILKFDNLLNDNIHSFLQRTYNMMINNEYGHYYLIKIAIEKIFILCESYYLMNNNVEQNIDNNYTNRTQECVIESLRYIDNHLSENVKVQDICKYLNVSQSYLYTCFKKVMKTSVSKAIIAYKLDRSLEMLQDKDLRIVDIANNVGFDNIYYFSNSFKKCFGISPTAFRQHYM